MDSDPFYEAIIDDNGAMPVTQAPQSTLGIKPAEKLIPTDKLWDDIFQNINKGRETRSCISLSKQDVASLVSSQRGSSISLQSDTEGESSQPHKSYVRLFTCGHNFPEKYFHDKILPEIESGLKQNGAPLKLTASLLKSYYKRDGVQMMACPRCVISALRT